MVMVGAVALLAPCASPAAAQNQTVTLRASATIIGGAGSDMLVAVAVTPDGSPLAVSSVNAVAMHDVWRISGSRSQQLSIQVESESSVPVAICELADGATLGECLEHHVPSVRLTTAGVHPEIRVRVGRTPRAGWSAAQTAPVLVTIAYIAG